MPFLPLKSSGFVFVFRSREIEHHFSVLNFLPNKNGTRVNDRETVKTEIEKGESDLICREIHSVIVLLLGKKCILGQI